MEQNQFVTQVFLRVKATNELLIPGLPYILSLYQDSMTGINYVKLYRYKSGDDGIHVVTYIDTTYPIRSYQFDELKLVTMTQDDTGYVSFKEEDLMNDSHILSSDKISVWSHYTFIEANVPPVIWDTPPKGQPRVWDTGLNYVKPSK